jgi:hypothetical protein
VLALDPLTTHADDFADFNLAEQRMRHRRLLRDIPAWIVRDIATPAIAGADELRRHPDRFAMEIHFREVADRLAGQLRMSLEELAAATTAAAAQDFYAAIGDRGLEFLQVDRERMDAEPYAAKYATCAHDFRNIDEVDHEALAALITAAAWADELAGDYRDPRI